MHWKGLRISVFDGSDSKRQTVVEAPPPSRHSEHLPRATLQTTQIQSRRSESAPRSPRLTEHDEEKRLSAPEGGAHHRSDDVTNSETSNFSHTSTETPSLRRNRFSFRRLRHASDPQLGASYGKNEEEDVPPVPPMPPPPMIITTAPTTNELGDPVKRDNNPNTLPVANKEAASDTHGSHQSQTHESRHLTQGDADSSVAASRTSVEEPGRLSTTSLASGGRDRRQTDSRNTSGTDARLSESSRSDQSVGDRGVSTPHEESLFSTKRFRLPRLKMSRASVFPLPPKPRTGPESKPKTVSADPTRKSTSTNVTPKSISANATPKSVTSDDLEPDQISPLPSPSRSSARQSSPTRGMRRNDSTKSAPSVKSFSSNAGQSIHHARQRSSTVGSMADVHPERPSPHLASSGRTSTSTSGRKSFGDLFSITHRLRQNSEPPVPRIGSPGVGGAGTPVSKSESFTVPEREEGDTPATYLSRLQETLPRGTIAGVLAQSGEEFFKTTLRKYMRCLSFFGDPIDMAIRKLLMEVVLPKETQQIDRVLQGFADRYHECNPGIFASPEQAYFIAFSILILHTDVFNKNNKRKMQKQDYVKNTRGESVADDILECFYENISYTPFIHIEDANTNGRHLAKPRRTLFRTASAEHLPRPSREPVDPYALIMDDKLDSLKPSLKEVMNLEDTYSCTGPSGPADMKSLHRAFSKCGILQILSPRSRPDAFMTPSSIDNPADSHPGLVDIRVAKVGLLWRKDPKKKRARSPWQEWGAILTFSQLYFFRDLNWVKSLISQYDSQQKDGRRRTVVFKPPLTDFKPDAIMSTYDAVALLDSSYKKHKHAFVFVRHNALEEIFLANTDADMDDWLAKLNYAAAFRTTGVRPKGMMATNYEAQRYRISNVDPIVPEGSLHSIEQEPPSPNIETDISAELAAASRHLVNQRVREANEKLFVCQTQLDDLLRNARHLQILTPIHPRAREQVIMAAGRMAAKLKWVRQDIWRIKCYREVLLQDMGEENLNPILWQKNLLPSPMADTSKPEPSHVSSGAVDWSPPLGKTASANNNNTQGDSVPPDGPTQVDGASPPPCASADIRRPSIPLSIASAEVIRTGRKHSVDNAKRRAKSHSTDRGTNNRLQREASALSSGSKMDVASLASRASRLTSTGSIDDNEERVLRQAGLLELDSSPPTRKQSSAFNGTDTDQNTTDEQHPVGQGEQVNRTRRSLHRTLRDSHHSHHNRSKKGRDSIPGAASPEGDQGTAQSGEGLSRKTPSFTVHGKKASVVTFGSEWQNMSPEERLKLRKPTSAEEPRTSDVTTMDRAGSISSNPLDGGRPQSLQSGSTVTKWSFRNNDDSAEGKETSERKLSSVMVNNVNDENPKPSDSNNNISPPVSPGTHSPAQFFEDKPATNSGSAEDSTMDQTTPQEKIQPSPAEQAVTA